MELITIYEDNEQKIEMLKFVADYLTELLNKEIRLTQLEAEQMLNESLYPLRKIQDLKGRKVITTNKIPILHRHKIFSLFPAYKELTEAVLLLSDAFDKTVGKLNDEQKLSIQNLIQLYYKTQLGLDCVLIFFDDNIKKVSGFIGLFLEETIIIFPFFLNEEDNFQTLY